MSCGLLEVLEYVKRDVEVCNEIVGLLFEQQLDFVAVQKHLNTSSELAAVLCELIAPVYGALPVRLTALVQLQCHVMEQLVRRLEAAETPKLRGDAPQTSSVPMSPPAPPTELAPTVRCERGALPIVRARFPHLPEALLQRALQATGDDPNQAIEFLLMPGVAACGVVSPESQEAWQVRQVFPDVPEDLVALALANTGNDVEQAINLLLVQGAAWATAAPVQHLTTAISRGPAAPPAAGLSPWAVVWMQELVPGLSVSDAAAALKAHNGNVLKAVKAVKAVKAQRPPPKSHPPVRQRASTEQKGHSTTLPSPRTPLASSVPHIPLVPGPRPTAEKLVAERLEAAAVTPQDFFKLNSRLMIATKRRVAEVMATSGLPQREAGIVVGQERLAERLRCLGLREVTMPNDGNCQFSAFSYQLYGTPAHHQAVRRDIVYYMHAHRSLYAVYFDGDQEFDRYLGNMAQDKVWGDEMTLKGVCDCFGIVVHLVMSTGTRWYHVVRPTATPLIGRHLTLSYLSPVHYNAVVLLEEPG